MSPGTQFLKSEVAVGLDFSDIKNEKTKDFGIVFESLNFPDILFSLGTRIKPFKLKSREFQKEQGYIKGPIVRLSYLPLVSIYARQ